MSEYVFPIEIGGTGAANKDDALTNLLPNQEGAAGKVLYSDGQRAQWTDPEEQVIDVVQEEGQSEEAVMSQKAVTDALALKVETDDPRLTRGDSAYNWMVNSSINYATHSFVQNTVNSSIHRAAYSAGSGLQLVDNQFSVKFGAGPGFVCAGDDPRILNAVPNHRFVCAGNGLTGGGELSKNITISADFGTTACTIAEGDDQRIINGQTAFTWGDHALAGYSKTDTKYLAGNGLCLSGVKFDVIFGSGGGTVAEGNDPRIVNALTKMDIKQEIGGGEEVTMSQKAISEALSNKVDIRDYDAFKGETAFSWGDHSLEGYSKTDTKYLPGRGINITQTGIDKHTVSIAFGNSPGTAVEGNDPRLNQSIPSSRTITAGEGLFGGGNLTSDISIGVRFGTDQGTVCAGDDPRINAGQEAFNWGNHAAAGYSRVDTRYTAGAGINLVGTTFSVLFGTTAGTVVEGNDNRLNNGQTAYSWGNHQAAGYAKLSDITPDTQYYAGSGMRLDDGVFSVRFGSDSNSAVRGDDPRLTQSVSRTPDKIIVTVGDGDGIPGEEQSTNFPTINSALAYLTSMSPHYKNDGVEAVIRLRSAYIMQEQVFVSGLDLSWISITSVSPTIQVRTEYLSEHLGGDCYPVFGVKNGGVLPVIDTLFVMTDYFNASCVLPTGSSIDDLPPMCNKHGIAAISGGTVIVNPGCGVVNAHMNGLYVSSSSRASVVGAKFSDAKHACVFVTDGSSADVREAEMLNAGSFGLIVQRSSNASAVDAVCTNSGHYGISAEDGSSICAHGAQCSTSRGVANARVSGRSTIVAKNIYNQSGSILIAPNTQTVDGSMIVDETLI